MYESNQASSFTALICPGRWIELICDLTTIWLYYYYSQSGFRLASQFKSGFHARLIIV